MDGHCNEEIWLQGTSTTTEDNLFEGAEQTWLEDYWNPEAMGHQSMGHQFMRSAGPLTMTEQRNRSPAKSQKNRPWFWGNLNIVIGLKWELVLGKWLNWFMNPPIKGSRNDSFRRFFSAAQWNETQIFTERPVRHVWNSQGTGGILGRLGVKIGPKTGLLDAKSI